MSDATPEPACQVHGCSIVARVVVEADRASDGVTINVGAICHLHGVLFTVMADGNPGRYVALIEELSTADGAAAAVGRLWDEPVDADEDLKVVA